MDTERFVARLSVVGDSVALPIPFDPEALWGARGRYDVTGTIDGHPIRGPLQREGDGWCLPLGPAWRRDTKLDVTQSVTAYLRPEGPLVDEQPADIADALRANATARAFFESIAPFYRKNYLRWIEEARRPETRAARIAETVAQLEQGKTRR